MDGMQNRILGQSIKPALCAAMLLPICAFASRATAAPAECSDFSGNWGDSKDAPYPGLPRIEIKDCEVLKKDVIGYWDTLVIGGAATEFNVYGNELYKQTVRGTWNQDRTELTIEQFSKVEAGFNPAFGSGQTIFTVQKWTLDPNDRDILHVIKTGTKFTRDTGKIESIDSSNIYYRFKGPVSQDPPPADTGPIPAKTR
jgi:hypothetical protein